jgi:Mg2+ and Co2+ transporter CorA
LVIKIWILKVVVVVVVCCCTSSCLSMHHDWLDWSKLDRSEDAIRSHLLLIYPTNMHACMQASKHTYMGEDHSTLHKCVHTIDIHKILGSVSMLVSVSVSFRVCVCVCVCV